jgi:hypothetical protein
MERERERLTQEIYPGLCMVIQSPQYVRLSIMVHWCLRYSLKLFTFYIFRSVLTFTTQRRLTVFFQSIDSCLWFWSHRLYGKDFRSDREVAAVGLGEQVKMISSIACVLIIMILSIWSSISIPIWLFFTKIWIFFHLIIKLWFLFFHVETFINLKFNLTSIMNFSLWTLFWCSFWTLLNWWSWFIKKLSIHKKKFASSMRSYWVEWFIKQIIC